MTKPLPSEESVTSHSRLKLDHSKAGARSGSGAGSGSGSLPKMCGPVGSNPHLRYRHLGVGCCKQHYLQTVL